MADWDASMTGKDLAGVFFSVLWGIIGDLDYYYQQLKLKFHGSGEPCSFCPCNNSAMKWSEFNPLTSLWMRNVYTPAQFKATFVANLVPGEFLHPLFTLPGVTCRTIWYDYMHCKYMGTDQYFLASVLLVAVFMTAIPGRDSMCESRNGRLPVSNQCAK